MIKDIKKQWVKGEGGVMRCLSLREAYPDEQKNFTDNKTGKTFVINDEFGKYSVKGDNIKIPFAFHLNTFLIKTMIYGKNIVSYIDFMYRIMS